MTPGKVVLVRFPFTSLEKVKKRPALVLCRTDGRQKISLVTIAMITSRLEGLQLDGDVVLRNWERAGLLHPSLVRLSKVATLDGDLVEKQLGGLTDLDLKQVRQQFRRVFEQWV